MSSNFEIRLVGSGNNDILPVSKKLIDYFNKVVIKPILVENGIIINGKWNIILGIVFLNSDDIDMPHVIPPNIYRDIKTKAFAVIMPLNIILSNSNPQRKFVDFLILSISIFFQKYFPSMKDFDSKNIIKRVDYNYLETIPFPAAFEEFDYKQYR